MRLRTSCRGSARRALTFKDGVKLICLPRLSCTDATPEATKDRMRAGVNRALPLLHDFGIAMDLDEVKAQEHFFAEVLQCRAKGGWPRNARPLGGARSESKSADQEPAASEMEQLPPSPEADDEVLDDPEERQNAASEEKGAISVYTLDANGKKVHKATICARITTNMLEHLSAERPLRVRDSGQDPRCAGALMTVSATSSAAVQPGSIVSVDQNGSWVVCEVKHIVAKTLCVLPALSAVRDERCCLCKHTDPLCAKEDLLNQLAGAQCLRP